MEEKEKQKGILSASPREAWVRFRKRFLDQMPRKRSINLAAVGVRRVNWLAAIPAIVLILLAAAAFAKLLVLDRMEVIREERAQLAELQATLAESERLVEDYDEVAERYAHYTYSGMTTEEVERADRVEVMRLLRRVVLSRTEVQSWSLSGNLLTMSVRSGSLQDVNLLVQRLLQEKMVDYCDVSTAATDKSRESAQEETENGEVNATVSVLVRNLRPREDRE